jgi:hypothetical protein
MVSVVAMAHADTYADYLEMAEGLSGQGYRDAAAVIAGTSLEVQLKALGVKHSVNPQAPNGGPKKMDAMNAELKTAGVYNALEHKQVTAWLAIRTPQHTATMTSTTQQPLRRSLSECGICGKVSGVGARQVLENLADRRCCSHRSARRSAW